MSIAIASQEFRDFQSSVVSKYQKYLTDQQIQQFNSTSKIETQIQNNAAVNSSFIQNEFIGIPSTGNDRYDMRYQGRGKRVWSRPKPEPKQPNFTPQMPLIIGTNGKRKHFEKVSIVDSAMHLRDTEAVRARDLDMARKQIGQQDVVLDGIVNRPQTQLEINLAPRDKRVVSTRRNERQNPFNEGFDFNQAAAFGVEKKSGGSARASKSYKKPARPKMALDEKFRYANNTVPRGYIASSARVRDIEELQGDVRSAPNNRFKKLSKPIFVESTKREVNFDPTPRIVLSRERMSRSHGGDLAVGAVVESQRSFRPEILNQAPRGRSRFANLKVDRKPLVVSTQKRMEVNVYDPPKVSKVWTNSSRGGRGLQDNVTNYNRVEGQTRETKVYKNYVRESLVSIKEPTGGIEAMQRSPIPRVAGSLKSTKTTLGV